MEFFYPLHRPSERGYLTENFRVAKWSIFPIELDVSRRLILESEVVGG
jgi:hypothetical protein